MVGVRHVLGLRRPHRQLELAILENLDRALLDFLAPVAAADLGNRLLQRAERRIEAQHLALPFLQRIDPATAGTDPIAARIGRAPRRERCEIFRTRRQRTARQTGMGALGLRVLSVLMLNARSGTASADGPATC